MTECSACKTDRIDIADMVVTAMLLMEEGKLYRAFASLASALEALKVADSKWQVLNRGK